jgi:hypothetical protein
MIKNVATSMATSLFIAKITINAIKHLILSPDITMTSSFPAFGNDFSFAKG